MSLYKVIFENNTAVSAQLLPDQPIQTLVNFGMEGLRLNIRWYILYAESESQAMEIAETVVKEIWGDAMGIKGRHDGK